MWRPSPGRHKRSFTAAHASAPRGGVSGGGGGGGGGPAGDVGGESAGGGDAGVASIGSGTGSGGVGNSGSGGKGTGGETSSPAVTKSCTREPFPRLTEGGRRDGRGASTARGETVGKRPCALALGGVLCSLELRGATMTLTFSMAS
eukprot:793500-Prymnesium_polylepis.1